MNAALYRLITENPLSRSLLTPAIRVEDIVADAPDLVEGSTEAGQAIINALAKGHSIDWTAGGNGPAARDAHGLLWLRDLRTLGSDSAAATARRLMLDWISAGENQKRTPFLPAVIAIRLTNLLRARSMLRSGDPDTDTAYADLVSRDIRRLRILSVLPQTPLDKLQIGLALLSVTASVGRQKELGRKGLKLALAGLKGLQHPDGGATQPGAGYTYLLLEHLVILRTALRAGGGTIPAPLTEAIERAAGAVRTLRHPDGGLLGFSRGPVLSSQRIGKLLSASRTPAQAVTLLADSGYARASAGDVMAFLSGNITTPGLPLEISADGRRLILSRPDTGLSGLQIARAPGNDIKTEDLQASTSDEGHLLSAKQTIGKLVQERTVFLPRKGADIRGEDSFRSSSKTSSQQVAIQFHLPSGADVVPSSDGTSFIIRPGERRPGWRFRYRGGEVVIEETIDPASGRRAPTLVLSTALENGAGQLNWGFRRIEG